MTSVFRSNVQCGFISGSCLPSGAVRINADNCLLVEVKTDELACFEADLVDVRLVSRDFALNGLPRHELTNLSVACFNNDRELHSCNIRTDCPSKHLAYPESSLALLGPHVSEC